VCLSGNALASISEVTIRRARLVLGWVTGLGLNSRCRKPISVYNQANSAWPSLHGMRNKYQPKGADALLLASNSRYGFVAIHAYTNFVSEWQKKNLCDPLETDHICVHNKSSALYKSILHLLYSRPVFRSHNLSLLGMSAFKRLNDNESFKRLRN